MNYLAISVINAYYRYKSILIQYGMELIYIQIVMQRINSELNYVALDKTINLLALFLLWYS